MLGICNFTIPFLGRIDVSSSAIQPFAVRRFVVSVFILFNSISSSTLLVVTVTSIRIVCVAGVKWFSC